MCVIAFNDDLQYWDISDLRLETCCQNKFLSRKEYVEDEMKKEAASVLQREMSVRVGGQGMWAKFQQCLWDLFEKPETSLAAKVISWVSVLFVVVSTIAMILNTMPEFQSPKDASGNSSDNFVLSVLETICIVWFTIEYLLRFIGAPRKVTFLKDAMNIVDVLAILPYFITLIVTEMIKDGEDSYHELREIVSVFRILRILRIFKLARHSAGLQSIAYTLKNSYKELALLILFLSMGVLVFSSLCYFAEKDEDSTQFTSIPATFWWAVITMTTVGYGDMHPIIVKIQYE